MSKFTYFEGLKLINLLHLVDFSCWDQSSIFGLSRGKFWVQNLRGRDSPLHFKLLCGENSTAVSSSVPEEIPGQSTELIIEETRTSNNLLSLLFE